MVNKKTSTTGAPTDTAAAEQTKPTKGIKKPSARSTKQKPTGAFSSITESSNAPSVAPTSTPVPTPMEVDSTPPATTTTTTTVAPTVATLVVQSAPVDQTVVTQTPAPPAPVASKAKSSASRSRAKAQPKATTDNGEAFDQPKVKKAPVPNPEHEGIEPKKYKSHNVYFLVDELGYKITVQRHGCKGGTFNSSSPKYAAHKAVTRQAPNPIRIRKSGSKWYHEYQGERIPITDEQKKKNEFMQKVPVQFRPKVTPIRPVNIREVRQQALELEQQKQQQQSNATVAVSSN